MSEGLPPLLVVFAISSQALAAVTNTAYVACQNEVGLIQPTVASTTSFTVTVRNPALTFVKSASTTDLFASQTVDFTLTIGNVGSDTAFAVTVIDTLPALLGYELGSASPPADVGWDPNAGPPERLRWTIAQLDIGAVQVLTFTANALDPGALNQEVANLARVHYENAVGTPLVTGSPPVNVLVRRSGPPPTPPPTPQNIRLLVRIYDASGRLVKTLTDTMVDSLVTVTRVGDGTRHERLRATSRETLTVLLSDGTKLEWDGRDENGRLVPNGIYTVRTNSLQPDGRQQISSETFSLTHPYEKVIESAVLVPNPADDVVWISFKLALTFGAVDVKIYAVSGKLIYKGQTPGTSRSFRWDLTNSHGSRVAQGLYVVVLEARDPWTGKQDRATLKLAVLRR